MCSYRHTARSCERSSPATWVQVGGYLMPSNPSEALLLALLILAGYTAGLRAWILHAKGFQRWREEHPLTVDPRRIRFRRWGIPRTGRLRWVRA